ncbi:MAG: Helix-turn-helix domain protein [Actinobacteria bacterium ADurb.Bin444]|nr:MAG: Helix-turn-helix domain protein [Actinobacteria bacterium ADurb.Bin444]
MTDGHRQGWTQYFDTRSAAEYLGLSPKTLEKLRWQGGGPAYYRLGGVRYLQDDLDEWRESRRRTSTSDTGPR